VLSTSMIDDVARFLTAIGALNWGLVDVAGFNLVRAIFGRRTLMSRVVYLLVALAGAWSAYQFFMRITRPAYRRQIEHRLSEIT
jgi:uncharacterized membrane protein YuzA (DUF378 family)